MQKLPENYFVKPICLLKNEAFDVMILIEEFFEGKTLLKFLKDS